MIRLRWQRKCVKNYVNMNGMGFIEWVQEKRETDTTTMWPIDCSVIYRFANDDVMRGGWSDDDYDEEEHGDLSVWGGGIILGTVWSLMLCKTWPSRRWLSNVPSTVLAIIKWSFRSKVEWRRHPPPPCAYLNRPIGHYFFVHLNNSKQHCVSIYEVINYNYHFQLILLNIVLVL